MAVDQDRVRDFARSYTEAWCSHDPARVAGHFAPGGTIAINGGEPTEITEVARSFISTFPDIEVLMDDVVFKDEAVEYHWTFTGTSDGKSASGSPASRSGRSGTTASSPSRKVTTTRTSTTASSSTGRHSRRSSLPIAMSSATTSSIGFVVSISCVHAARSNGSISTTSLMIRSRCSAPLPYSFVVLDSIRLQEDVLWCAQEHDRIEERVEASLIRDGSRHIERRSALTFEEVAHEVLTPDIAACRLRPLAPGMNVGLDDLEAVSRELRSAVDFPAPDIPVTRTLRTAAG